MVTNDPRRIHPDFWGRPADDTYSNDRPTDPGVGGQRAASTAEATHGLPTTPARATTDVRRSAALQRAIAQSTPRPVRLRGTGTAPATGALIIGLGGPAQGHEWIVRRVNVGPLDYAAGSFPTGVTTVLVISSDKSTSPPDSGYDVVSMTTAYPAEGTWGDAQLHLSAGEVLRLLITGLPETTPVTCGGQAWETATGVIERQTIDS